MDKPQLIVIMGVSGSGKTTVARTLAAQKNWCCLDADDFHSEQARQRMSQGRPLSEEMRGPWIHRLCARLRELFVAGHNCLLAFSGLRKDHRDPLRATGFNITFVLLDADQAILKKRLQQRKGHFAPVQLLDSQLETLEPPQQEADVHRVDGNLPLPQVLEQVRALLGWQ